MTLSPTYTDRDTDKYRSVPEVIGEYKDTNGSWVQEDGTLLRNTFLPFYVYNVYKPVVDTSLEVTKTWKDKDGNTITDSTEIPANANIDVTIKRYKMVEKTGTLNIHQAVSDQTTDGNAADKLTVSYTLQDDKFNDIFSGTYSGTEGATITGLKMGKTYYLNIENSAAGYAVDPTQGTEIVSMDSEAKTVDLSATLMDPLPEYGSIVIRQSVTGNAANEGRDYYRTSYVIRKDGAQVASGSYSGIVAYEVTGLPVGDGYTVELTNSSTNEKYSVGTENQTVGGLTVVKDGTTDANFHNTMTKPVGSITISQSLTGNGASAGAGSFTANYTVKKGAETVASGSYSGATGATVYGLEPGDDYSVEITCAAPGYEGDSFVPADSRTGISVTNGGNTDVAFSNVLESRAATVTLKTKPNNGQQITIDTLNTTVGKEVLIKVKLIQSWAADGRWKYSLNYTDDGNDNNDIWVPFSFDSSLNSTTTVPVTSDLTVTLIMTQYDAGGYGIGSLNDVSLEEVQGRTSVAHSLQAKSAMKSLQGEAPALLAKAAAPPENTIQQNLAALNDGTKSTLQNYNLEIDQEFEKVVHLPEEGSWSKTVEELESTDEKDNPYIYFISSVEEHNVPTGTVAIVDKDGNNQKVVYGDHEENGTNNTLGVTDYLPTQVDGTKTWVDAEEVTHNYASEVHLILKRKTEGGDYETVTAAPTWVENHYYYVGLSSVDTSGNTYTYSVEETPVPGYETSTNGYNITNTVEETQLTVNKVWEDGNENHTDDSISYTLYQIPYTGTAEYDPLTITSTANLASGYTGTLSAQNNWTETVTKLPKAGVFTPTGANPVLVSYKYYIAEGTFDGYSSATTGGDSGDGTYSFTITNKPNSPLDKSTDLSITKSWKNAQGVVSVAGHENDSITFRVTQKKYTAVNSAGKTIYPVTINLINGDGRKSDQSLVVYVPAGDGFTIIPTGGGKVSGSGFDNNNQNASSGTAFRIASVSSAKNVTLALKGGGHKWTAGDGNGSGSSWKYAISNTQNSIIAEENLSQHLDPEKAELKEEKQYEYAMMLNSGRDNSVITPLSGAIGTGSGSGVWSGTIADLPFYQQDGSSFYMYTYVVSEVKTGTEAVGATTESGWNGETSSYYVKWEKGAGDSWTITNQKKPTGALKITKLVTVNGQAVTPENASLTDGTYTFVVYESDGTTPAKKADGSGIGTVEITYNNGQVTVPADGYALVNGLAEGTYVIREAVPQDGMSLVSASRGDGDTSAVDGSKAVTVVVTAGDTTAANTNAQASFTNNLTQATVKIIKVIRGYKDSDHTLTGASFQLTRVNETNDNKHTEYPYESDVQEVDEHGVITFTGLKPGRYKLEEKKAPNGYILKEGPWFLRIDQTGAAMLTAAYEMASPVGETDPNAFYIENESGAELPASGGSGTHLLYLLGGMLTISAAVILCRKGLLTR